MEKRMKIKEKRMVILPKKRRIDHPKKKANFLEEMVEMAVAVAVVVQTLRLP
jgi:hypothetical protein